MANNRITSNKKNREKTKQQKRLNKQKRKEERRDNPATSFDDMIAYVDEYGVLHSEPQEAPKEQIDVADVVISTPKQEEVTVQPLSGHVDFFNAAKGFGFIKLDNSADKYFFHISNAPQEIKEGDYVTFELEQGMRGMNAVRISITNNQ